MTTFSELKALEAAQSNESAAAEYVELSSLKVKVDTQKYSPRMVEAFRTGEYEINERHFCAGFFERGDRVLEVGSSVGVLSMVLARAVGEDNYIGFEANPELMPDALENFRNNGMDLTYHTAVLRNRIRGGAGEPVDFFINKDFWISALVPSGNSIRIVQVPVLCLEDEIDKFHANALMMDIEGAECELLLYADLSKINKIFMELHYWPSREAADKMVRYLVLEGFNFDLPHCSGHTIALRRNYPDT